MCPGLDDLAGRGRRFFAHKNVDGYRNRYQHSGDHSCEDNVAGAFGVGLTGCGVCSFLLEKTHNDLILCLTKQNNLAFGACGFDVPIRNLGWMTAVPSSTGT